VEKGEKGEKRERGEKEKKKEKKREEDYQTPSKKLKSDKYQKKRSDKKKKKAEKKSWSSSEEMSSGSESDVSYDSADSERYDSEEEDEEEEEEEEDVDSNKKKKKKKKEKKRDNSEGSVKRVNVVMGEKEKEKPNKELFEGLPKMSREEWEKQSEALFTKVKPYNGESLFDATMRIVAKLLPIDTHREYVNYRFVSKMGKEPLLKWMTEQAILCHEDKFENIPEFERKLIEHTYEGLKIRKKENEENDLETHIKNYTEEEIMRRKILSKLKPSNFISEQNYKQKLVYMGDSMDVQFTFLFNLGKNWTIKSDLLQSSYGDCEFFPVVAILKASYDPSQKKPYYFSISRRHVSIRIIKLKLNWNVN